MEWFEVMTLLQQMSHFFENGSLLCELRNMVGQFKKAYLHRPIKILHFLTPPRIQKYLT